MSREAKSPRTQGDRNYEVGDKKPPKECQFGQPNGNKRGKGFFKKEDTARYKLERMMKLSEEELLSIVQDPEASLFDKRIAVAIRGGKWSEISDMINQVYGPQKQKIETDSKVEIKGITVKVINPTKKNGGKDEKAKR